MLLNSQEYIEVVGNIKKEIYAARHKAVLGANKELICLYWNIGKVINENSTWGNKFIENLAKDIKLDFPNSTGYSVRNLKYMAKFQKKFEDFIFVQQAVAQIPWGHNILLIDKIKEYHEIVWYIDKVRENGWSRNVLLHQIQSNLYERQGQSEKISNFVDILASPQSELALQTMKDPYIFDFIELRDDMVEREIEQELAKITLQ